MPEFNCYFPEDGETVEDGVRFVAFSAEDAANMACDHDFNERDGWDRQYEEEFLIAVVDSDGREERFSAYHYKTVAFSVSSVQSS